MVQKEVGERLTNTEGNKNRGECYKYYSILCTKWMFIYDK